MAFNVATTFLVLAIIVVVSAQDFGFPEDSENVPTVNKDNRVPILAPDRCGENELLYPGDQKDDWVCDCGPAYVYYPPKDQCYSAYRKGPCAVNQYLILKQGEIIPSCQPNPCKKDGMVRFKGGCYALKKAGGPCPPAHLGGGTLGVNASTLELQCLKTDNILSIFNVPTRSCPPGGRRASRCRVIY